MLREVSVANDVDYPSLTGDYSQTNYSSTRLQTLDTRDMWRVLQSSYIRSFRMRLNREWSAQAVTFGALPSEHLDLWISDQRRYEAARYLPRGWHWVDPTKEVGAYKEAERAMYMTKTDIIAETAGGQDLDDLIATRKREIEMLEAAGIQTDTTDVAPPPDPVAPKPDDDDEDSDDDDDEERSNVRHFSCL
jgi:capsid protein